MMYSKIGRVAVLIAASFWGHVRAETTAPPPTASPIAPAAAAATPAAAVAAAKFSIWEIRVLGNTRLADPEIERSVYPFLGPDKSFDVLEAARAALEKYYHDRGFGTVFVDIPEQEVADGIVRLRVTEGKLARVKLSGTRYFEGRIIRAQLPEALSGNVPNVAELQKELAAVNTRSADLTVVPVLHAGNTPGTVDLDLKVEDRLPLHGSVELNNAHTPDTEPLRIATSLSYNNIAQTLDSVSLQYQLAPQSPSSVKVIAGTLVLRFGQDDPALTLYAIDTNSDVATIGTLSVLGSGDIFGSRLIWALSSSASRTETVSIGADYKKFRDNIRVTAAQTITTDVDYLPFSINYNLNLNDLHGSTAITAGLTWALRGLVSSSAAFNLSRAEAPSDFIYLRGSAARTQQLPFGLSAHLELDGQATAGPLIANEQFNIGGAQSVRGYYEAEELGDSGIRGSFELHSPTLQRPVWAGTRLYGYGFFDWAAIELHDPLPSESARATFRSTGVGFRLNSFQHLDANLDWAYVLENGLRTYTGQTRYNFSISYGF